MLYSLSIILLAGGQGSRIGGCCPKQFIPCRENPIAFYSLETLLSIPHVECVLVCDPSYRHLFAPFKVVFADPGKERMLSVEQGLKALSHKVDFVLVHDAARPFVKQEDVLRLLDEGSPHGAATLAVPLSFTLKKGDSQLFVTETLPRESLWEIQTPQLIKTSLLEEGLKKLTAEGKIVTDEMSIAESLGHPVKLIPGNPMNFKITTPKDLLLAKLLLEEEKSLV